jgi:hypothetical protein
MSAKKPRKASGLGVRAFCTVRFKDSKKTSHIVEIYAPDLPYSAHAGGSFWAKWLARKGT